MIRKKTQPKVLVIDITGPDGNAFVLLEYAKKFAAQLDLDYKPIEKEMFSSNYENLLQVFDKYFGSFVILER